MLKSKTTKIYNDCIAEIANANAIAIYVYSEALRQDNCQLSSEAIKRNLKMTDAQYADGIERLSQIPSFDLEIATPPLTIQH